MKVLITGGTGCIGSAVVRELGRAGHYLRILTRRPERVGAAREGKIEVIGGDLAQGSSLSHAVRDVDAVCHIAGILGGKTRDLDYYRTLHVEGTARLLQALGGTSARKVIHCSTAGVVGPVKSGIADETWPYNPGNIYETTKAEAEKLAISYGAKQGLAVTVLRPGMTYGPGDMHHLGLFKAINNGYFFLIGSGETCLDPVYVEDVARAFRRALEVDLPPGEIFMISGPKPVTVRHLASTIASAMNKNPSFYRLPKSMCMAGATMLSFVSALTSADLPLTPGRVRFLTENRRTSIAKAQERLGYEPIPLEDGIRKTVNWYKEHGFL